MQHSDLLSVLLKLIYSYTVTHHIYAIMSSSTNHATERVVGVAFGGEL